eukprot:452736_1
MAGIPRNTRTRENKKIETLLWDKSRVTIQIVSVFLEKLSDKQRQKIWEKHATGEYIVKKKLAHTLHTLTCLCIKIKDRSVVVPSRHDIENKLILFTNHIEIRIENKNGMNLQEFNKELYWWILEPVSSIISNHEQVNKM